MENAVMETQVAITSEQLLEQWQGHRRLTRKVIEAFPEDKLFSYSIGGMRPFAELAEEMIAMAGPGVKGVATGKWEYEGYRPKDSLTTKEDLLKRWDDVTEQINSLWPTIPPHRLQEIDNAFGQYEGPVYWHVLYFIDNEIHHRGQGYVYLRSLGIQPPAFWDRG